jgi:PEGA domain-containing protein
VAWVARRPCDQVFILLDVTTASSPARVAGSVAARGDDMQIAKLADEWAVGDPLLLFDSEHRGILVFEPDDAASPAPIGKPQSRTSRRRWLAGMFLLAVGLLVGYAGGVLTMIRTPERQRTSADSFVPNTSNSASKPAALHSESPIAQSTNLRTAQPSAAVAVRNQRQVSEREATSSTPRLSPGGSVTAVQGGATDSQFGVLRLESRPAGARVHLDGELVTTTPFSVYRVPSGTHTVRMELEGYKPFTTSVNVVPGSHVRIASSLEIDPGS